MADPSVVELARAALRRLAEAEPTAEAARATLESIASVSLGPPYTVAIAGEISARTALLDHLAGEELFEPERGDPDRIVLTMRRGPVTSLRARHRDGSVEQHESSAPVTVAAVDHTAQIATVPFTPAAETAKIPRQPPWWAVWSWIALWFRTWRDRRRPQLAPAPAEPPPPPPKPKPKPKRKPTIDPRWEFIAALRKVFADESVERLFIEIGGGPLPDNVVVLELPTRADPKTLAAAGVDACLVACGAKGPTRTKQLDGVLAVVPHLFAVAPTTTPLDGDIRFRRLVGFDLAAPALILIAKIERALAVGRRAIVTLSAGRAKLDGMVDDAESKFRARIDKIETKRIPNAEVFATEQLARVRPLLVEQAHRSIRRALEQIDSEIERIGADWSARLRDVTSTDALRAAAAKIDEESPAALRVAHAAARQALLDDLSEHALGQFHELVSQLREGTTRAEPLPWWTVDVSIPDISSGTSLGTVAPRLTSLFRSLDAIKTEALSQLDQRIDKLRQVAAACFLDAEPRLEPAVTGTIAGALRAEIAGHDAWVEKELARERAAVDAERTRLAAVARVRDAARSDERALVQALGALESELP